MRRTLLLMLSLLLMATAVSAAVPPDLLEASRQIDQFPSAKGQGSESERLHRFFDLHWRSRMLAAPEYATYIGYAGLDDRLGDASPETIALARRMAHQELAALDSIARSRLAPAEQVNYDLLHWRLEQGIEGEKFPSELMPIHQLSGVHQDIVDLLAAMPARNVQDYENRLSRLRAFPKAIEQTLDLLKRGLAAGITPPRVTLRDVPGQITAVLTDDPGKSPAVESFQKIPETIPAADRERLRREASRIFQDEVAPALRRLREYLVSTYIPGARETTAMSDLPDGRAWYAYLVRTQTTTDLTPDQIHQLGLSEVKRIRGEMDALIASTGFKGSFAEFCNFLRTDPRFFYDRPEDLIAGYRDITKRIDPELVKLFGKLPRLPYGVTAVPAYDAKSQTTGYYANGSLAAGRPGWFNVNTYDLKARPKWEMEALASHESVPGHHIMYALIEELGELPAWRKWDVYPAMSEGWALYAESLGSEIGLYKGPYSKFGQLVYEMWRALRLVVDTGLHTQGWTRQQALDYMRANSARTEHDIVVEVDRYIVTPGGAVVYKIGELKIKELRAYAQKELGPKFDIRAFHDHVLGSGQLPLALLEKSIKAWVAGEKGR
ncbi:MAG TPA: DUF885 domain-containing protein [Thermoanaerobaculia bacterium]|jgi:uncharacterized protein (DUF885 family)|nr:DUF885 domain-containing protein [Thermoanaerobaculia bacterium]